jgi:hypothetical protein
MSVEWFVERTSGVSGPYTSGNLKRLAEKGAIKPTDLIRKGSDGRPVPASGVTGLFAADLQSQPKSPPSKVAPSRTNDTVSPEATRQFQWGQLAPNLKFLFVGTPNTRPTIVMRLVRFAVWTTSVIVGLFVFIFVAALIGIYYDHLPKSDQAPAQAAKPDDGAQPRGFLGGLFRGKPKLAALKKVVAKYKETPDPLDGATVNEKFRKELAALQQEFHNIPFDPMKAREQGKEIIHLYETGLKGRYDGLLFRELDDEIAGIATTMRLE